MTVKDLRDVMDNCYMEVYLDTTEIDDAFIASDYEREFEEFNEEVLEKEVVWAAPGVDDSGYANVIRVFVKG